MTATPNDDPYAVEPDHGANVKASADDLRDTPGTRLRMFRETAGKTRAQLAGLMGCSTEAIRAIETGRRQLTLNMGMRAAEVLGIGDLSMLYGPQVSYQLQGRPTHEAIPDVRRALLTHQLNGNGQNLQYLNDALESAWTTWHASPRQRTEVGRILPGLIIDTRRTMAQLPGDHPDAAARRRGWGIMAEVYHLSQVWLAWHGDRELSWLSTDRGVSSAQETDDPIVIARAAWYYSHLLSAIGQSDEAVAELDAALVPVEPLLGEDTEAAAVWIDGQMRQALNLARAGDESAWARWEKGHDATLRLLPDDYVHAHTRIGRTLVEVYAVMVAVALGDGEEAYRRAMNLDPDKIPSTERKARHLLELARGQAQRGEEIGSLTLLRMALEVSQETIMYSPAAQSLTRDLMRAAPAAVRTDVEAVANSLQVNG